MSTNEILTNMPWWYQTITLVLALYYAVRAVVEQKVYVQTNITFTQKLIIHYIQEFLFKFIITISAFVALFAGCSILSSIQSIGTMSAGTAALLIFLFLWGVIGASGYLTFLIATGKIVPGK